MPTMEQVREAATKLPNAYHFDSHERGPVFRIAMLEPLSVGIAYLRDDIDRPNVRYIEFRLEERKDPASRSPQRRWVYAGPVVV